MERRTFLQSGAAVGAMTMVPSGVGIAAPSRSRHTPESPLRLNANENPLGLSPAARQAVIAGIPDANRYPFTSEARVVDALAARLGLASEQIVMGAGSTEVLQMAVQVMGQGDATFIIAEPTFEDVPRYAEPWNLRVEEVPLRPDFSHDIDRMRATADRTNGSVLVYVCNPNNPTGTITTCREVDEWIETASERITFLVDEAYFEYAEAVPEYWSAMRWVSDRKNVVVVRTFSKIFGMAGMRLGYGIAHPETAARLQALAGQNNVNHLASMAALASLRDENLVPRSLESNDRARTVITGVLDDLGIDHLPSHTNFLMHRIRGDLTTYIERMREEGYLVGRPFPPMLAYNRLSLAAPEEMEGFGETLRAFRKRDWV